MIQCDSASVPQTTSFTWTLTVKSSPEVPRFIIVGFQTINNGDQRHNPSMFNHVGVKSNVNAGTVVYAIIISDRLINFQSDGNKMSVVF